MENKDEVKLSVVDANGEEKIISVILYFSSQDESKTYILYREDETNQADDDIPIYAAELRETEASIELLDIKDSATIAEIDNMIKELVNGDF